MQVQESGGSGAAIAKVVFSFIGGQLYRTEVDADGKKLMVDLGPRAERQIAAYDVANEVERLRNRFRMFFDSRQVGSMFKWTITLRPITATAAPSQHHTTSP